MSTPDNAPADGEKGTGDSLHERVQNALADHVVGQGGVEAAADAVMVELRRKCPDHGVRWCPECDDPDLGYAGVGQ